MIDREIRPGRICIIINSIREHNNGKVVEVSRLVHSGEYIKEFGYRLSFREDTAWLVIGSDLLQGIGGIPINSEFAIYETKYLLPIDDLQEDTIKHKEEEFSE